MNISELDIIGATEVFNRNDGQFKILFNNKEKMVSSLNIDDIKCFCEEESIDFKKNFLNIKIISLYNNKSIRTDTVHNLIDYTDDENRCLLSKGTWYSYNDDYMKYLDESISEIECIYNPSYDFTDDIYQSFIDKKFKCEKNNSEYEGYTDTTIKRKLKKKYYSERVFNIIREKDGFKNYDREIDSTNGSKLELIDLYKQETMYAVKIGNSSGKLCYAVDQSISSIKMYKHKALSEMPLVKNVAIWLVLERKTELSLKDDGTPDLTKLNMLMLKNKIDSWKKEVRVLGYTPQIYINYKR